MKSFDELKEVSDKFFNYCDDLVAQRPWAVCLAMHEYFRKLYPNDPYIPFDNNQDHTERVYKSAHELIEFLKTSNSVKGYNFDNMLKSDLEVKKKTGQVYGALWENFSYQDLTAGAVNLVKERFEKNGIDLSILKGKKAIDIGCGSGRFTFALKELGCKSVVGVDYGVEGLAVANKILEKECVEGVSFKQCSVLDLPFEDDSFEFVWCNGVLHHTENMEQGLSEMIRVAKPTSNIWLYLYGDGGIFWYARKKMPEIMKKIPQEFTMGILNAIGMPTDRFIFTDNWYVPIERHTSDLEVRKILSEFGISKIDRLETGRSTDLEFGVKQYVEEGTTMWGDGELRYILEK